MWAVAMEAALREIIQVLEMDLIGFGNQLDGQLIKLQKTPRIAVCE